MRQMKPLLKENDKEYTWTYTFDVGLNGGDPYSNSHSRWWNSSYYLSFDTASFPFWFRNGIVIEVDWGDGTVETIEGDDSIGTFSENAFHVYSIPAQVYTISITSRQWDYIWLCGGDCGNGGYPPGGYPGRWYKHNINLAYDLYGNPEVPIANVDCGFDYSGSEYGAGTDDGFSRTIIGQVAAMRMGCHNIINPLPHVAGILTCDPLYIGNSDWDNAPSDYFDDTLFPVGTFMPNSMFYAFGYYYNLATAPSNLFENNLNAIDFTGCLWGNTTLDASIQYDRSKNKNYQEYYVTT